MPDQAERAFRLLSPDIDGGAASPNQLGLLGSLFNTLDVGFTSVDSGSGLANVNRAAANLLSIPAGDTTAAAFDEVIRRLARAAINQADVTAALDRLDRDPAAELKLTWQFSAAPTHLGVVCKPVHYPGFDGQFWAFYDNSALARAVESSDRAKALMRASSDAMLDPQVLAEGVWEDGRVVDLVFREVNLATCEYLGRTREQLTGQSIRQAMPNLAGSTLLANFLRCAQDGEPVITDEAPLFNHYLGELRYYDTRAAQAMPGWITVTWRDVTERAELARRVAASEEQFRLLAENVADVVVVLDDDSTVTWISKSVEKALGAPPEHWTGRRALDFSPPHRHAEACRAWAEMTSGGTVLGRLRVKGADDRNHTIHLHSKPYYGADGQRNGVVASFRVIDDEVAAEEVASAKIAARDRQNLALTELLQAQTDRLMGEMSSAARYVAAILPGDLDGPVRVSSRYVSSRELGGDSYDYRWIDDDHLIVYLLDVSGHGTEPAMVSVSVHNLLRSGTLSTATLCEPADVVAELNRLFKMERHGGNYFTIWYGVYRASTRTLRFCSTGHPPALALTRGPDQVTVSQLSTPGLPVGLFDDTAFETDSYVVPHGAQILVYSDGAFELSLSDDDSWSLPDFVELCTEMVGAGDWSLDDLISTLKAMTSAGVFADDCTLVRLSIP